MKRTRMGIDAHFALAPAWSLLCDSLECLLPRRAGAGVGVRFRRRAQDAWWQWWATGLLQARTRGDESAPAVESHGGAIGSLVPAGRHGCQLK